MVEDGGLVYQSEYLVFPRFQSKFQLLQNTGHGCYDVLLLDI